MAHPPPRTQTALFIATGLLLWLMFHNTVARLSFTLDLGSGGLPQPIHVFHLMAYLTFGTAGCCMLAIGLARSGPGPALAGALEELASVEPRRFVTLCALLAFGLAAGFRANVLLNMPITDDEAAYEFMARVLAGGALTAPRPPEPLFFDWAFMINDRHRYAQYFLGWPALMVPFVAIGIPGYANAVLSGVTVPAVYIVAKQLAGDRWARVACVLYVLAPMVFIGAATQLSHTACIFALAWAHAGFVLASRPGARLHFHALTAFMLCLAFFNRPVSTLGIGLPIGVAWLHSTLKQRRVDAAVAFLLPASVMGGLFLYVNAVQTGDAFKPAYQALHDFIQANNYRFSNLTPERMTGVSNMRFDAPLEMLDMSGVALLRLNQALFGWPFSLALVPFAVGLRRARVVTWMLICFVVVNLPVRAAGIDSYGPVHYSEAAWPVLLLSVAGLRWLHLLAARFSRLRPQLEWTRRLPVAALLSCMLASVALYLPARTFALHRMAEDIRAPHELIRAAQLGPTVIFLHGSPSPRCRPDGERMPAHFVYYRPLNDPKLQNETLWVNHLSLRRDREFMRHFPGRKAMLLWWHARSCSVSFEPLEEIREGQVQNGILWVGDHSPDGGSNRFEEDVPPGAPLPPIEHP